MDFPHLGSAVLRMTGLHPAVFSGWAAPHGRLVAVVHAVLRTIVHGRPIVVVHPILRAAMHGRLIAVMGRVCRASALVIVVLRGSIVRWRLRLLVLVLIGGCRERHRNEQNWGPPGCGPYQFSEIHLQPPWFDYITREVSVATQLCRIAHLAADHIKSLRRAQVTIYARIRASGRDLNHLSKQKAEAFASAFWSEISPQPVCYCVTVFTASPTLNPFPETTLQTAEASSTSVTFTTPTGEVILRITLPVDGSLISCVTRSTLS